MKFDFDNPPAREGTLSLKFDFAAKMGHDPAELPMWVADMDFPVAPGIREALARYVDRGFFGYSDAMESYVDAAIAWFRERHGVEYRPEWLVKTPGVVFAISTAVAALTEPGDAVLIQTPVYYPFAMSVVSNGRKLVQNELVYDRAAALAGRIAYSIDFADFEQLIVDNDVKLFILCSPHNPVGRVWTPAELAEMGRICREHGVKVVADEIHSDLILPGNRHTPFIIACPESAEDTVVCTAPSKTFSLAGLQCSNIWIPDEQLRARFQKQLGREGMHGVNILGIVACEAAYSTAGGWLDQAIRYIAGNVGYQRAFIDENLPELKLVEPQGTYLTWVDFSGLGMETAELDAFVQHEAKLWLDAGSMFGGRGGQFQRFNLACPRSTVEEAMRRLSDAIGKLRG